MFPRYTREVAFAATLTLAAAALLAGARAGGGPASPSDPFASFDLPADADTRGLNPPPSFVNFETAQVHPIATTPDGSRLLVTNTADARLEVFSIASGTPVSIGSVPVGIDPVAVRARTNTEAWVVNHISDSISIVDLTTMNVVRTLQTLDEPSDVVFAGTPQRAFVTCAQANTVQVFDPADLSAPPINIPIDAERPRSLAVSPDGSTVYAAIFESGNRSTILGGGAAMSTIINFPPNVVSNPAGPYGGVNPPPNSGASFVPPRPVGQPTPPRVGLIVKKNDAGQWMDDNGGNWTSLVSGTQASASGRPVGWDLPDRDLAIISTSNLNVSYAHTLMNICMAVGVNPASGNITVVGTDGTNEVRFEPNVNGTFVRVLMATVDGANPQNKSIVDLNPHLTYTTPTIPQSQRVRSVGDPRAVVWNGAGNRGYIAGMGSNNVIVVSPAGARAGLADTIPVGEGPTGIALDEPRGRMYVLNRFGGSISVVGLAGETELARVPFFDPTPAAIKVGRKHLYNTHRNSGLGHASCASCHIDSRMDRLAWDLGDPAGHMEPLTNRNLGFGLPGLSAATANPPFQPFHPMKGPMTTQTLQDIIGHEPHHWRGDRLGIEEFNGAFVGLQGAPAMLTPAEMQEFEDFLATIHYPPNPFRNFDNTLPTNLPLPGHFNVPRYATAQFPTGAPLPNGNALNGMNLYRSTTRRLDQNTFACVTCHTLPSGAGPDYTFVGAVYQPLPPGPMGERHHGLVSTDGTSNISTKVAQLRNLHKKRGFNMLRQENNAGFGYLHDGSVDSIERFLAEPAFTLASVQELADMVAFMLAFSGSDLPSAGLNNPLIPPGTPSKDAHAAVGRQVTLVSEAAAPAADVALINQMIALAGTNRVGLIVKGRQGGVQRGYTFVNGNFQSDRQAEVLTPAQLRAAAAPGSELTFTVVPKGTEIRMGIDRDMDGCLDRDNADGSCGPQPPCPADWNGDELVNSGDITAFLTDWLASLQQGTLVGDFNGDGQVNSGDITAFLTAWLSAVGGNC